MKSRASRLRHPQLVLALALIAILPLAPAALRAEGPSGGAASAPRADGERDTLYTASGDYRTPRAGEALETRILGRHFQVPERDRNHTNALNLGGVFVTPDLGGQNLLPFGALYTRHFWDEGDRRLRGVLVGVYNELLFIDSSWNDSGLFYGLTWFNDTIPVGRTEILRGEEIKDSETRWGELYGGLSVGWHTSVPPGHVDNRFITRVGYEPGYFYAERTGDTGDDVVLPPDTPLHRLIFEIRYDGFERNVMELLHEGKGLFLRTTYTRRADWRDHGRTPSLQFEKGDTHDFVKIFGFGALATGIPSLSERHRLTFSAAGGWLEKKSADRFSGFRMGGGPPSSESASVDRTVLPGALFDQVVMQRFVAANVEYRYEALFFLFFHLRASFARGNIPTRLDRTNGRVKFNLENSGMFSFGMTSGFFWSSQLYLEYAYNQGQMIRPDSGHGVVVSWSKSF